MRRIWDTIRDIPRGQVASYGQIAEIAGIPRGARQVGYALKHAPENEVIPWHRVVTASGKLAFAPGSQPFREQSRLLFRERVPVSSGRVDMGRYRWRPNLDELLWKPGPAWDDD
jgi:methylated-DNA-protein-cysteine methyltransferase-like protein